MVVSRMKILVSACLLGENCKYNGGNNYNAAVAEFAKDEEANYLFNMLFQLTIITITFGILIAYLLLEFVVPLLFKNGQ